MMDARHLTKALADPPYVLGLDAKRWASLLAMADAEQLTGSLSWRLDGLPRFGELRCCRFGDRQATEVQRAEVLREAAIVSQALAPAGNPVILLNQAAFVAAGLDAARGLHIANLEILVPQAAADDVGAAVRRPGGPAPPILSRWAKVFGHCHTKTWWFTPSHNRSLQATFRGGCTIFGRWID